VEELLVLAESAAFIGVRVEVVVKFSPEIAM
jgi:hypothetical protein